MGLVVPCATARLVEHWPYERLFKEADLVVIAEATATVDTGEVVKVPGWSVKFNGVHSTFAVKATLKGKLNAKNLTIFHLRLDKGVRVENGPRLISFAVRRGTIPLEHGKSGAHKPDYLLFLKKGKDGRYEPVSGQIDPDQSVKEVHRPFLGRLLKEEAEK
jgi:hypothetical protein